MAKHIEYKAHGVTIFAAPPWRMGEDEVAASDSPAFHACDAAAARYAAAIKGYIASRAYSTSQRWGKILRARIGFADPTTSGPVLLTCWSVSDPNVEIVVAMEGTEEHAGGN